MPTHSLPPVRRATVIIPAFNEELGIGSTLTALLAITQQLDIQIIVVDDGSGDATASEVRKFPGVDLIQHPQNRGYGSAIRTGTRAAEGAVVIWYDADGQHRPEDLLLVLRTLEEGPGLDYCIGIRGKDSHHVKSRAFGKFILRSFIRFLIKGSIKDFNSGLRGFRIDVLRNFVHLLPKGFGASTTTSLILEEDGYKGVQVPIRVEERIGKSSVKQFRDGMRTLMLILHILLLFRPMQFFGFIGLTAIGVGMTYGIYKLTLQQHSGVSILAALIILFGTQSCFFGLLCDQVSALRRERLTR